MTGNDSIVVPLADTVDPRPGFGRCPGVSEPSQNWRPNESIADGIKAGIPTI